MKFRADRTFTDGRDANGNLNIYNKGGVYQDPPVNIRKFMTVVNEEVETASIDHGKTEKAGKNKKSK